MTKEEELDWLYRLRSEIYVYMPKEWLIPMNNALDMAIKDLEQEPKTDNDLDMKLKLMEANVNGYTQGLKDASNTEQESKYCDRNICLRNEYNGIGCDECEVTKSQEPSGEGE